MKKSSTIYQLATCALMTTLMCVLGPMSIQIGPIPISFTNFVIYLAVYVLGMRAHSLNNDSPYWGGIPEGSVELSKTVFDWGNPMLECLIQSFKFPVKSGTHVDFISYP